MNNSIPHLSSGLASSIAANLNAVLNAHKATPPTINPSPIPVGSNTMPKPMIIPDKCLIVIALKTLPGIDFAILVKKSRLGKPALLGVLGAPKREVFGQAVDEAIVMVGFILQVCYLFLP
jgi:hypothetical protein